MSTTRLIALILWVFTLWTLATAGLLLGAWALRTGFIIFTPAWIAPTALAVGLASTTVYALTTLRRHK